MIRYSFPFCGGGTVPRNPNAFVISSPGEIFPERRIRVRKQQELCSASRHIRDMASAQNPVDAEILEKIIAPKSRIARTVQRRLRKEHGSNACRLSPRSMSKGKRPPPLEIGR